jgi:phosphatidylserine/phosphatidylglycerophosphate/cardiolipin synthase-like enzyme
VFEFVTDREIYLKLICKEIPKTRRFLWLATSDLKDLYVDRHGKMVPFLELLSSLCAKRVELRLLHAKQPGPRFWRDYKHYPKLDEGLEMMLCPRVHLKAAIIDGERAYSGSANLTGAGVGAKSSNRRNFESGFITDEPVIVEQVMEQFDAIWRGSHCKTCQRKEYCAEHEDILNTDSAQ